MSKTLGVRLRSAREAVHPPMSQRAIAKHFKVTPGTVSLWEAGKTEPRVEHLAEMARIYNVSTDWLTGVESKAVARPLNKPPVHTVPVVPSRDLVRWRWDAVIERLQTAVAYPEGTAAAIQVSSDALTSQCPTGAYAVISKAHPVSHGCVVLAATTRAGEPVLRRLVNEGDQALLLADDARWPTLHSDPSKIIGRVVEVTIRRRI